MESCILAKPEMDIVNFRGPEFEPLTWSFKHAWFTDGFHFLKFRDWVLVG